MSLSIIGNISVDYITTSFEVKQKSLGGAALNIGIGYYSVATVPNIVSVIGTDIDSNYLDFLKVTFPNSCIKQIEGKCCSFEIINNSDIEQFPEIISQAGVSSFLTDFALSLKYNTDRIHLCCTWPLDYIKVAKHIKSQGAKNISLNFFKQNIEQFPQVYQHLEFADYIFLNLKEFEYLKANVETKHINSTFIVTNGGLGSVAIRNEKIIHTQEATNAYKIIDVTGAGDVFAGAFLRAIEENDLASAMKCASDKSAKSLAGYGVKHLIDQ